MYINLNKSSMYINIHLYTCTTFIYQFPAQIFVIFRLNKKRSQTFRAKNSARFFSEPQCFFLHCSIPFHTNREIFHPFTRIIHLIYIRSSRHSRILGQLRIRSITKKKKKRKEKEKRKAIKHTQPTCAFIFTAEPVHVKYNLVRLVYMNLKRDILGERSTRDS